MTASTELGIKASSDTFLLPCVAPLFLKGEGRNKVICGGVKREKNLCLQVDAGFFSFYFFCFFTLDASLSSIFIGEGIKHDITKM